MYIYLQLTRWKNAFCCVYIYSNMFTQWQSNMMALPSSCSRKRAIVSFISSVRRLLCASSIVYVSIGGLCLRQSAPPPLHGPPGQRAAHWTRTYDRFCWTVDHTLCDGRSLSEIMSAQIEVSSGWLFKCLVYCCQAKVKFFIFCLNAHLKSSITRTVGFFYNVFFYFLLK